MKKTPNSLKSAGSPAAHSGNMRRITLDGRDGLPAPVVKAGEDGIGRIHKVEQSGLELFSCPNRPSRGTVMVCPGGGYSMLAINHEGRDIAKLLNGCGYDAAVLLYRVGEGDNTRSMALSDAMDGLSLLQKRAPEFGLCTKQIGIMGFSAGAHLSARLAHETGSGAAPDFLVLVYPAYLEKDGRLLEEVAPPKVPVFVYVAKNDPHYPSSSAYAGYCGEHGVKCSFHQAGSGGHGFGVKTPLPEGVGGWTEKLARFLKSL
ncbi:MAG: alpha/beta hydrolase [Victivallales bacterium]